jgi:hypothetical protein
MVQGEPQDPEGAAVADPAVGPDGPEAVVGLAAGADHELADASGRVGPAGRGLGGEAFVVMVVADQHHVRAGPVERAPEGGVGGVVAVHARAEPGLVPVGALAVEGDQMPGPTSKL